MYPYNTRKARIELARNISHTGMAVFHMTHLRKHRNDSVV